MHTPSTIDEIRNAMNQVLDELGAANSLARAFRSIADVPSLADVYCNYVDRMQAAWEPLEEAIRRFESAPSVAVDIASAARQEYLPPDEFLCGQLGPDIHCRVYRNGNK